MKTLLIFILFTSYAQDKNGVFQNAKGYFYSPERPESIVTQEDGSLYLCQEDKCELFGKFNEAILKNRKKVLEEKRNEKIMRGAMGVAAFACLLKFPTQINKFFQKSPLVSLSTATTGGSFLNPPLCFHKAYEFHHREELLTKLMTGRGEIVLEEKDLVSTMERLEKLVGQGSACAFARPRLRFGTQKK